MRRVDPFEIAEQQYDDIRRDLSDVRKIARNLGLKAANVQKVKEHLFLKEHVLDRYVSLGVPAERRRFDADPEIASAWQRLISGLQTDKDVQLLIHEIAEAWCMRHIGLSYDQAHKRAQASFPAPEW